MKKTNWVVLTLTLLVCNNMLAQGLHSPSGKQLQLSLHNGLSSFLTGSGLDSVYFLKPGYQAGIEGNYYWNNFGLAGRVGYFNNAGDRQAMEDFARKRKAPRDRVEISPGAYKGMYFFTGPAFRSMFNKWQLESSLEGGLISKPAAQVMIGDIASPDVVYYRNVFDESNSFAWSAGLSISYALSSQFLLGVNADYLNTRNDVVNYDIQRGNGREAKNITSQAGFLNTGLRLSYLFNSRKPREASTGLATGKRTADINGSGTSNNMVANSGKEETQKSNDTCNCEDKVMDVREMEPYIVEIQFETVEEARVFLDTYEPVLEKRDAASGQASGKRQHSLARSNPMYQQSGHQGVNPLYENKRTTVSNTPGIRGLVHKNEEGGQSFYLLPTAVDLAEVLSLEDGRVTVHVQRTGKISDFGMSRRDAATGQASGKRTYKPVAVGDLDGDGVTDLLLQSIIYEYEIKSPRDVASGQSSGRRSKIDAFTIKQGIIEADLDGDGEFEPLGSIKSPRDVASGQASGKRTAAKEDVYVWKIKYAGDLNGDGLADGFICSDMNKEAAELMSKAAEKTLTLVFNDDIGSETSNNKVVEKATSGIKQTMQTQVLMTNGDAPDNTGQQKAGISTSRSNIRTKQVMSCGDGACMVACEIDLDGRTYRALVTARAKHDTPKNAIGNIR